MFSDLLPSHPKECLLVALMASQAIGLMLVGKSVSTLQMFSYIPRVAVAVSFLDFSGTVVSVCPFFHCPSFVQT